MGAIDHLAIETLGADDACDGLALSGEARWNQNEADWRFFLTRGTVFGIRDGDGHLIATAALLPYSSGNAWISMVLVTQSWRRRGLATKLLDTCLDAAAKQGVTAWLDATPAGATVYGPLGFAPTLELRRLRFAGSATAPELASDGNLDEMIARDRHAMGFDRSALLRELSRRSGSQLISHGSAMALIRGGRTARHIGPLFADDAGSATALVETIAQSETGPILIDVVSEHDELLMNLTNSGWSIERPFQRMRFGRATIQNAEPPIAVAGPEYG
ncbi:GNAT family N-acetyltransferase [Bradyrhizobium sp.]|jgi:GNAT superfamily N-acetyltransferase|uniref:GNAT family N-acetyltransferase n=1 Tax=Bradyrhizobium sp. TaxID=376 RepID=UPI002E099CDE|nr:GNAT family N-acetyltransferase [Bradyrhizobium sp.]